MRLEQAKRPPGGRSAARGTRRERSTGDHDRNFHEESMLHGRLEVGHEAAGALLVAAHIRPIATASLGSTVPTRDRRARSCHTPPRNASWLSGPLTRAGAILLPLLRP